MSVLWVFRRVPELDNAQGFLDVPDVLGERLVREGKASATYDYSLVPEPEPEGAQAHQVAPGEDEPAPMKRGPGRPRKNL